VSNIIVPHLAVSYLISIYYTQAGPIDIIPAGRKIKVISMEFIAILQQAIVLSMVFQ